MAPRNYALDIWAGNTFVRRFVFKDENGDPTDLTGAKVIFKANNGSSTALRLATDEPGSGFEITDAAAGQIDLLLTYAQTRALPNPLRYEIEIWLGDEQTSLIFGQITVTTWVNDDADP